MERYITAEGHANGYLLSKMNYNYKIHLQREDISYTIPFEVKKEKHVEIYNIRGTTENYPIVRKVG